MIAKEKAVPGAVAVVAKVIKDGLPPVYGGPNTKSTLTVRKDLMLSSPTIELIPGDEMEVVSPPHKRHGVNCVEVKVVGSGEVGLVFWCEFRVSTNLKESSK
jgi:hypothetical protein